MAKLRTVFRCVTCDAPAPQWSGRCPSCGEWNALVEEIDPRGSPPVRVTGSGPVPIGDVDLEPAAARPTGVDEVDRVLSGGLVPGSVTLLAGEPGVGKSTLLLQVAAAAARGGATVLYASAEESRQQVRLRAGRLGALADRLYVVAETSLPALVAQLDDLDPDLVVVDSVQTLHDPDVGSAPGSVTQVRECTARLVAQAKVSRRALVVVGHVTKEGAIAGPRLLEHLVDTVLTFDGERHHALRLLRVTKHRFGSTDELGVFEMLERGLVAVPDPSALFLADRRPGVPGSAVVPLLDGRRALLAEVQALVARTTLPVPRRTALGVDGGRLALLLAVLGRRSPLELDHADVHTLVVGGARAAEPGADLAVALAVVSSATDLPLPSDLVAVGEVGLGGEVRQVHGLGRRLAEAARLGFRRALVPRDPPEAPRSLTPVVVGDLRDAVVAAGLSA